MAEKSVIAYFKTPEDAQAVGKQLKSMGVEEVQVDQFGKYPGTSAEELMNPISGGISSQADLVLGDISTRDIGVLTSADPSASGLSDGGFDTVSGRNIILTAVMDESLHQRALRIVRQAGGLA